MATGTVLAFATGLGLFFNSLATKSSNTMTNVLFGNLLAISDEQLLSRSRLCCWYCALSIGFIYRPLLFASVNAPVAEARGLPVRALSIIFMALLGSRGDDGGPGGRDTVAVRADRDPGGHGHHADPAAGDGDVGVDRHQRRLGVVRAGGIGDVQRPAELLHRHDRLRRLARRLAERSTDTRDGQDDG